MNFAIVMIMISLTGLALIVVGAASVAHKRFNRRHTDLAQRVHTERNHQNHDISTVKKGASTEFSSQLFNHLDETITEKHITRHESTYHKDEKTSQLEKLNEELDDIRRQAFNPIGFRDVYLAKERLILLEGRMSNIEDSSEKEEIQNRIRKIGNDIKLTFLH